MVNDATLLCLGSGKTPRYKANTLQLLALPAGSHVQFRYAASIITPSVKKKLDEYVGHPRRFYFDNYDNEVDEPWRPIQEQWRNRLRDEFDGERIAPQKALLAHVDTSVAGRQSDGHCRIVPCRFAYLVDSYRIDEFYILVFRISDFAVATNSQTFQRSLPNSIPHWMSSNAEDIGGMWCQELERDTEAIDQMSDAHAWVRCIDELRASADFSQQPYFFMIEGIFYTDRRSRCKPDEHGNFVLNPSSEYEFRLFHYDPDADVHTGDKATRVLTINAAATITLRTSSRLAIDSPYDLKVVRFSTSRTTNREFASLILKRSEPEPDPLDLYPELFFPIEVRGAIVRGVVNGLVLGLLLSAQAGLAVLARASPAQWLLEASAAIALGVCTGLFVSFGMKKPF
jgi:hypothetical protein